MNTIKKKMNRENNYEILRIICTFAVIFIHMSGTYKNATTDSSIMNGLYTKAYFTISFYNIISRFAVPCFMMLTGAFCLSNEKNSDFRYFYRKCFVNVGVPTFIFSVAYLFYRELIILAKVLLYNEDAKQILLPIKDLLCGSPYYHMWYLYTLIGVYLIIPIIIRTKNG